jgi:SPP1 family phage portal protein
MLIEDLYRKPFHEKVKDMIANFVKDGISEQDILVKEIKEWEASDKRKLMVIGEQYYKNKTEIRDKKTAELKWQSNNKLEHGFLKKLVDQKVGYLLSKEPTISTNNKTYADLLQEDVFNKKNLKAIKNLGKEAINKGIAYLYVYYNEQGEFSVKKLPSQQIIPFWTDDEHTEISAFLRVYQENINMDGKKKLVTKVEYHHSKGINYYEFDKDKLIPDVPAGIEKKYHMMINKEPFLWSKIPLIPFKYNEEEQPLVDSIKSLVDNYNNQASTNADLLADIPKFIYKLINYEGENLAEFIENLQKYKAIKLGEGGNVDKLQAEPATDATEKELDRDRKSIYEFGRGVDTTDEKLGNASGVALRYRYSDLDMDCNILESEFQSSLEHLLWFVDQHFLISGKGDFTKEPVNIIFNRDIIINESEVITDCSNSIGILDDKTIRENHPWYNDEVEARLEKQKAKEKEEAEEYNEAFNKKNKGLTGDE